MEEPHGQLYCQFRRHRHHGQNSQHQRRRHDSSWRHAVGSDGRSPGPAVRTRPGVVINNSGTINATTRAIDTSGTFSTGSITVNNNAGATIASANDAFRINTNVSNGTIALNNAGTVTSTAGQALDFAAITAPTANIEITNTGTIRLGRR